MKTHTNRLATLRGPVWGSFIWTALLLIASTVTHYIPYFFVSAQHDTTLQVGFFVFLVVAILVMGFHTKVILQRIAANEKIGAEHTSPADLAQLHLQPLALAPGGTHLTTLVQKLSKYTTAEYATVAFFEKPNTFKMLAFAKNGANEPNVDFTLGPSALASLSSHQPSLHLKIDPDFFSASPQLQSLGVKSLILFPLTKRTGELLGTLGFLSSQDLELSDTELVLLSSFVLPASIELAATQTTSAPTTPSSGLQVSTEVGLQLRAFSHDLNNILMSINGNASLLSRNLNNEEKAKNFISRIERASDRATEISASLSAIGKGLPLKPPKPAPARVTETPAPNSAQKERSHIPSILFVDDENDLVELALEMLSDDAFNIIGYSNPVEALGVVKQNPQRFSAVISDITMPKMTGFDLAREILKVRPDMPIILASGLDIKLLTEKDLEGRFTPLKKPYDFESLKNQLSSAVRTL